MVRQWYVINETVSSIFFKSATPPSSSPHRVPWQHLHALNQDLQSELEVQKRKQDLAQQQIRTLKRSYTETQDAVVRHETDIQALLTKLASAMAEILASEEAVARMRNELKLEQERSKEREEEHTHSETTLRAQLKESEDRLREVEASLLERNQALRHLERQQALQRDHMREIQRLQERLQEVTARLSATEEGQALKEERLRKEQHSMKETHEKEKQNLCKRLTEAETTQTQMQRRVLEAEQQVEALLRGKQACGRKECDEEILKLQENLSQKTDMVESLRETVRRLEEERGHLTCRCQELLNQIAEADREVNKLRNRLETEEADYNTLENSYEKATQEFQKMSKFLREKEEEIQQTKEMYERLVVRKEGDLKEALIKMTVLGNSLEETEQKLQAKEELLYQMSQNLLDNVEPCSAEKDLQAKLVVAEDRIAELERHLNALQLDYADLHMEIPEQSKKGRLSTSDSSPQNSELPISFDKRFKTQDSLDDKESLPKRPRIRFSSIQCHKYMNIEGFDTSNLQSTFTETTQNVNQCIKENIQVSEGNISSDITFPYSSDPEKFISIIHALETKLLATEDKLKNLTQNLVEQQSVQTEPISKIDLKITESKPSPDKECICHSAANKHYAKALLCVENSQEKVRSILSGSHDTTDSQLHSLSEIENELLNATLYIKQGQKTLEEQSPIVNESETPETLDKEALHLFAKTLSFEAAVLNKMALFLQTPKPDLLQALTEVWEDLENIKRSDKDCLAIIYTDVLTRKLMLETAFWKELEKAETGVSKSKEGSVSAVVDVDSTVVLNTFIKAELAYSIQNLKYCYEEKLKTLKRELTEARKNLYKREMALKAIIEASKRPDLKNVIKEVKNNFGYGKQKLADVHPPELAPYMEQIETEEARELAEEIVDKHLSGEMSSCGVDSLESLQSAHDILSNELQKQAGILNKYAQEILSSENHPELAEMIHPLVGHQTSPNLTSTSLCMREALIQAQVAYVACRLRALHEQEMGWCKQTGQNMDALVQQHAQNISAIQEKYEAFLQEKQLHFTQTVGILQTENQTLKSEISKHMNQISHQQMQLAFLEEQFQKETAELKQRHKHELSQAETGRASVELALMETTADSQRKLEVLLVDMDSMEERHESHVRKLEEQFKQRFCELQQIHQEELEKLRSQYVEKTQLIQKDQQDDKGPDVFHLPPCDEASTLMEEEEQGKGKNARDISEVDSMVVLKDRIQELETQMNTMRDELENKHLEGDVASLREKYQRDFESLKVFALSFHFSGLFLNK